MKLKRGSTSVRRLIFIADSSSTTGAGLASLVYNSAGLVAYYFAGDLSNEVAISLATATLGTWTSGGFVAVDNTNMPGWYEIGIPDAALDAGNEVAIQLRGATNMVPVNLYIELDTVDYQTAIFGGMASYTQPTGFLAASFPSDPADQSAVEAAITAATSGLSTLTAAGVRTAVGMASANLDTQIGLLATAANLLIVSDGVGFITAVLMGSCADAGTAGETYVITFGGATYTADYTGLDATGNRTTTTRTKT